MRAVLTLSTKLDRRWIWSLIYGTILGGAAFAVLLNWAGFDNVWSQITHLHVGYLATYVGLTIGNYFLRAWRFQLLIGSRGTVSRLYGVVSIHNLMVNLLPLSGGELSYPFLLKHCGMSSRFVDGIPSIIVARLQDLLISGVLLVAALGWVGRSTFLGDVIIGSFTKAIALSLLILAGALLLYRILRGRFLVLAHAQMLLSEVVSSVRNIGRAVWVGSFLIALSGRLTSIIATFYLIQAVGVFLSFPIVFLICNVYVFLPLLPLNTVAGLGITEAFLLLFFVASGIDQQMAAVASINVHLLQLIITATLGAIGTVLLQYFSMQGKRAIP